MGVKSNLLVEDSENSSSSDGDAEHWVLCDGCHKWRRVAAGYAAQLDDDTPWYCSYNPDPAFASCEISQEMTNEQIDEEDSEAELDKDAKPSTRLPVVWQLLKANIFSHRKKKVQHDDDIMICHCPPVWRGGDGCGPNCINRLLNIECVSGFCPCEDKCTNQMFSQRRYAKLEVKRAGAKGFGLFAAQDIKAGQFIIEYIGEVLDEDEYMRRKDYYISVGQRHYYFMNVGNGEVIDAARKGNHARFINHSCEPNCETQKWVVRGELAIGLFALKDVQRGEELTFDYNFERYGDKPMRCYCGTRSCRKFIGGAQEHLDDDKIGEAYDVTHDLEPVMVTDAEVDTLVQAILDRAIGLPTDAAQPSLVRKLRYMCQQRGIVWMSGSLDPPPKPLPLRQTDSKHDTKRSLSQPVKLAGDKARSTARQIALQNVPHMQGQVKVEAEQLACDNHAAAAAPTPQPKQQLQAMDWQAPAPVAAEVVPPAVKAETTDTPDRKPEPAPKAPQREEPIRPSMPAFRGPLKAAFKHMKQLRQQALPAPDPTPETAALEPSLATPPAAPAAAAEDVTMDDAIQVTPQQQQEPLQQPQPQLHPQREADGVESQDVSKSGLGAGSEQAAEAAGIQTGHTSGNGQPDGSPGDQPAADALTNAPLSLEDDMDTDMPPIDEDVISPTEVPLLSPSRPRKRLVKKVNATARLKKEAEQLAKAELARVNAELAKVSGLEDAGDEQQQGLFVEGGSRRSAALTSSSNASASTMLGYSNSASVGTQPRQNLHMAASPPHYSSAPRFMVGGRARRSDVARQLDTLSSTKGSLLDPNRPNIVKILRMFNLCDIGVSRARSRPANHSAAAAGVQGTGVPVRYPPPPQLAGEPAKGTEAGTEAHPDKHGHHAAYGTQSAAVQPGEEEAARREGDPVQNRLPGQVSPNLHPGGRPEDACSENKLEQRGDGGVEVACLRQQPGNLPAAGAAGAQAAQPAASALEPGEIATGPPTATAAPTAAAGALAACASGTNEPPVAHPDTGHHGVDASPVSSAAAAAGVAAPSAAHPGFDAAAAAGPGGPGGHAGIPAVTHNRIRGGVEMQLVESSMHDEDDLVDVEDAQAMTARQRARMVDLSLLLDVVLKTTNSSARKEFVRCGILSQLQAVIGRNFTKEYCVILKKILRVLEVLPITADDVHSTRSAHGTFADVLQSMSQHVVDKDVRDKAAQLLRKFPVSAISDPQLLARVRSAAAAAGGGGRSNKRQRKYEQAQHGVPPPGGMAAAVGAAGLASGARPGPAGRSGSPKNKARRLAAAAAAGNRGSPKHPGPGRLGDMSQAAGPTRAGPGEAPGVCQLPHSAGPGPIMPRDPNRRTKFSSRPLEQPLVPQSLPALQHMDVLDGHMPHPTDEMPGPIMRPVVLITHQAPHAVPHAAVPHALPLAPAHASPWGRAEALGRNRTGRTMRPMSLKVPLGLPPSTPLATPGGSQHPPTTPSASNNQPDGAPCSDTSPTAGVPYLAITDRDSHPILGLVPPDMLASRRDPLAHAPLRQPPPLVQDAKRPRLDLLQPDMLQHDMLQQEMLPGPTGPGGMVPGQVLVGAAAAATHHLQDGAPAAAMAGTAIHSAESALGGPALTHPMMHLAQVTAALRSGQQQQQQPHAGLPQPGAAHAPHLGREACTEGPHAPQARSSALPPLPLEAPPESPPPPPSPASACPTPVELPEIFAAGVYGGWFPDRPAGLPREAAATAVAPSPAASRDWTYSPLHASLEAAAEPAAACRTTPPPSDPALAAAGVDDAGHRPVAAGAGAAAAAAPAPACPPALQSNSSPSHQDHAQLNSKAPAGAGRSLHPGAAAQACASPSSPNLEDSDGPMPVVCSPTAAAMAMARPASLPHLNGPIPAAGPGAAWAPAGTPVGALQRPGLAAGRPPASPSSPNFDEDSPVAPPGAVGDPRLPGALAAGPTGDASHGPPGRHLKHLPGTTRVHDALSPPSPSCDSPPLPSPHSPRPWPGPTAGPASSIPSPEMSDMTDDKPAQRLEPGEVSSAQPAAHTGAGAAGPGQGHTADISGPITPATTPLAPLGSRGAPYGAPPLSGSMPGPPVLARSPSGGPFAAVASAQAIPHSRPGPHTPHPVSTTHGSFPPPGTHLSYATPSGPSYPPNRSLSAASPRSSYPIPSGPSPHGSFPRPSAISPRPSPHVPVSTRSSFPPTSTHASYPGPRPQSFHPGTTPHGPRAPTHQHSRSPPSQAPHGSSSRHPLPAPHSAAGPPSSAANGHAMPLYAAPNTGSGAVSPRSLHRSPSGPDSHPYPGGRPSVWASGGDPHTPHPAPANPPQHPSAAPWPLRSDSSSPMLEPMATPPRISRWSDTPAPLTAGLKRTPQEDPPSQYISGNPPLDPLDPLDSLQPSPPAADTGNTAGPTEPPHSVQSAFPPVPGERYAEGNPGAPLASYPSSWKDPNPEFEAFVADTVRHRLGKYTQPDHPSHIGKEDASSLFRKIRREVIEKERHAWQERSRQKIFKPIERSKLEANIKEFVRVYVRRLHTHK